MPLRPAPLSTFAIGSLPHTQQELALQQALRLDLPTLPQLPREDPAEFMLPQALEGLPGLHYDADGRTTIDAAEWERGSVAFGHKLERALAGEGLERFEPSGFFCRAWKPFLWEVEQARPRFAKMQLAGPLTSVWATTLPDGAPLSQHPALESQVVKLVLTRALAMTAALKAVGTTPILFLDEPGLYAYDKRRPSHLIELQQISIAATALHRAGAIVGLHCCGNTDWSAVFGLGLDIVSADVRLSLASILTAGRSFDAFLARGGFLALGIIPTNAPGRVEVSELVEFALETMGDRRPHILARALLAPACGLALRTVVESEQVYEDLREAQRLLRAQL